MGLKRLVTESVYVERLVGVSGVVGPPNDEGVCEPSSRGGVDGMCGEPDDVLPSWLCALINIVLRRDEVRVWLCDDDELEGRLTTGLEPRSILETRTILAFPGETIVTT